jgi:PAS domain S-box-containing protein
MSQAPTGIPASLLLEVERLRQRIAEIERVNSAQGNLAELWADERRFRALYEDAPLPYQSLDADGRFVEVNNAWLATLGYTRDEVVGRWFGDFLAPRYLEAFRHNFPCFKRDGAIRGIEFELIRKDGQSVSAVFDGRVGKDASGHFRQTHCIFADVTARRRAEAALHENEARYRALFETMAQGVVYQDAQGLITAVNPAAERILGRSAAEMAGMTSEHPSWEAIHEDGTPFPGDEHPSMVALHTGRAVRDVLMGIRHLADGSTRWILISAVPGLRPGETRPSSVCTTFTDITERRAATEALRQSEAKYRELFDSMLDGYALHEAICDDRGTLVDYRYLEVNPAFEHYVGKTRAEMIGKRLRELWPQTESVWLQRFDEVVRTGQSTRVEHRHESTGHWYLVHAYRPAPGHFAIACTDIDDRKRAEEERERLELQLRQAQKMEALGRLAGGVAHDFNNVLTAILGSLELATDGLSTRIAPADPAWNHLQQVSLSAGRAASLTRQLLAFSRRQVTQPGALDLNRTITGMEQMLRRLLTEDTRLTLRLAPDVATLYADVGQMEQVIMNLVVNARDALSEGGMLTLETRNVVLDNDYVALHPEARTGPHVLFAVSDNGCGMDAATRERIFEPFFTTKPMGQGTGLGLATVYANIRQAGGHVTVYSELGVGTTFKLYIPATDGKAVPAEAPGAVATPEGAEVVLLVEDDMAVRTVAEGFLRRAGYQVLVAASAAEAVRLAAEHGRSIDLLVTDVIMPDMNGRALAGQLAQRQPGLRTLYVSGYTANVIAHHGVLDEGVEFLEKPFTRRDLLRRVREVLDRRTGKTEEG